MTKNIFASDSSGLEQTENFNITNGRPDAFDEFTARALNTYRWWGLFGLHQEPYRDPVRDENNQIIENESDLLPFSDSKQYMGKRSLFNNSKAVGANQMYQISGNAPLLDSQQMRARIRLRGDCSVKELVRASANGEMGRAIYSYSDFMYCKYLGRTSNNYLVTLRRFPYPCGDHINYMFPNRKSAKSSAEEIAQQHMPDIGRLVTWMGTPGNDMTNILKYSVNMPYKELSANIQDLNQGADDGGILGNIMNLGNPSYVAGAMAGKWGGASLATLNTGLSAIGVPSQLASIVTAAPPDSYRDAASHKDENRPYGPVDVIAKTHIRQGAGDGDGGLQFNQDISLQFDYELRSYDNINTRAAFLDLLANILAVTYTTGKFWGGGFRQIGPAYSQSFTNLPIWKLGQNGKIPSITSITDAFMTSISSIGKSFNNGQPINSLGDAINAVKNLASNVGSMLLGGALNALGRPQKQGLNSLLNPAPVGLWHLMIGNPKHPIMSMGNMILSETSIEHYGPLGLDDFPTGIRVEIKLKHGKPRDISAIEQMYHSGNYRIYHPMGRDVLNMYQAAAEWKSSSTTKEMNGSNIDAQVNQDAESSESASDDRKTGDRVFIAHFGMPYSDSIKWASMEAHRGSVPGVSAEEAEANAREIKAAQDAAKAQK